MSNLNLLIEREHAARKVIESVIETFSSTLPTMPLVREKALDLISRDASVNVTIEEIDKVLSSHWYRMFQQKTIDIIFR